ncbi:MAG: hypothetical protein IPK57_13565 [Chitinophagaceae bacterium]|nr:hypothetical protein [Chitinophagaceae bacterium]
MQSGKQISLAWYVAVDFVMAALAWLCFYFWRSWMLNDAGAYPISYASWLYILLIVPAGWLVLYTIAGTYNYLYKIKISRIYTDICLQSHWSYRFIYSICIK